MAPIRLVTRVATEATAVALFGAYLAFFSGCLVVALCIELADPKSG